MMEPITGLALLCMIAGAAFLARHATRRRAQDDGRLRWRPATLWRQEGENGRCRESGACLLKRGAKRQDPGKALACGDCGRTVVRDSYGSLALGVYGFERAPDGPLVSSLCGDGTHAPAIDVDYGLTWLPKPRGRGGRLVFRVGISDPAYRKAVLAFEEAGIGTGTGRPEAPKLPGVQGFRAMTMRSEAGFDLAVPAIVVGSRTPGHHHLYLETRLDWPRYERLLTALADSGLIERAFADAAVIHRMTLLRRPGVELHDDWDDPPRFRLPGPPPAPAADLRPVPLTPHPSGSRG